MTDLATRFDPVRLRGDLALAGVALAQDDGLETAVLLSLFTDRRAEPDDPLPDGTADRRGWWGDALPVVAGDRIGSRLWLLSREKQTPEVLERAREYAREALAWLVEEGRARAVEVEAEVVRPGVLGLRVVIDGRPLGPFALPATPAAEAAPVVVPLGPFPSLDLDFTKGVLDPRITFSRASIGTYWGADGKLKTAAAGGPRFDHDPVTREPLGLLIEEARTNLLIRSEAFETWTVIRNAGAAIVAPNTDVAPDGATTADTLTDDDTALVAPEGISRSATIPADTAVRCFSLFVKKDAVTSRFPTFHLVMGANRYRLALNTQTGQVVTFGAGVPAAFGVMDCGAYWRVYIAGANDGVATVAQCEIYPAAQSVLGGAEPASVTGSIVAWGAQLEVGAFPTSYIPTADAGVTRAADVAYLDSAVLFNAAAGTLFAEGNVPVDVPTTRVLAEVIDTGSSNPVILGQHSAHTGFAQIIANGANQGGLRGGAWTTGRHRLAIAYGGPDFSAAFNGELKTSGAITYAAPKLDRLRIGSQIGNLALCGQVRRVTYHPVRLPNEKLVALTA